MSAVVRILEDHLDLPEFNLESRFYDDFDDHLNFQGLRDKYGEMLSSSQSQPITHSSNITGRESSSSSSA